MQNATINNLTSDFPLLFNSPLSKRKTTKNCEFANHHLTTDRLYMRPVKADDFNDYLALYSDPSVMRFIGIEAGYIPGFEEIEQIFRGTLKTWKMRGYGRWSMFDSETQEFVGFCGFRCENGVPELIAALHEKYWGRGLAVEAATACLKYGYNSLGFTTVSVFTRPSHSRARQVLMKLGACFDGYIDFYGVAGASYHIDADQFIQTQEIPN